MKWPTHTDYQDSIQNPADCFQEPDLKAGTIACDMLGLPRVMSGNFASVYELRTPKGRWAIRCFVRQVMGQQGRYARLSQYLSGVPLDCLVKFEYLLKGILAHGEWYPIVQMEWVQGQQLNVYVEDHLNEPETLLGLAAKWRVLVNQLRAHKLAHSDFQHGNVMVTAAGEFRLVDYDGMYCPAFGRGRAPELGHANYQHPRRTPDYYEERLDNFSALVTHLSFLALAKEPELWSKFNNGDNLLLSSADYRNTQNSEAFLRLQQSPDPCVRDLAALVRQCCISPIALTPWFEEAVVAMEQGTLPEMTASLEAQGQGTVMITPGGETWLGKPTTKPAEVTEVISAPAGSRLAESPATAPMPGATAPAGNRTPWLALAAGAVLLLAAGGGWFLFGPKQVPSVSPPTATAPATDATPTPAPEPAAPAPAPTPQKSAAPLRPASALAPANRATELRSLSAQSGPVSWTSFSPNGRTLLSGVEDGTIKIWEPASGKTKQTLPGQGDGVYRGVFLGDGKTLATVSSDNTLRYWDMVTAQITKTIADFSKNLWTVVLSPDGQILATGAADRKIVRLVDPQSGAVKRLLSQHASWVRSADFSPDSKFLAVSCWDDVVKVWAAATGEAKQSFTVLSNTVDGVCFSADSQLLATAGQGRTVKVWDLGTGKLKQTLIGHTGDVRCYAFSPSGRVIAAGGADHTVLLWDVASGQVLQSLGGHSDAVTAVAFSPDGAALASGSADQTVKLWDVSKLNP